MPSRQSSRKLSMQSLESRYALDGDPLGNGEEIRREVGQEDPFDEFYFDAQAGDHVWLALQEERPKSSSQVELTIRTPSGGRIYDWGNDSAFEYFQANESGRFRVFVSERGNEQDFDYKLRFLSQPGSISFEYDQDAVLSRGETHGASLPAGSLSVISFDAIAGTTVFTSMGETSSQSANPRMWLFDPTGSLVTVVSDEVAFTEEFVASNSGSYTAIVGDFGSNEPLSYTFSLATLPGEVDYTLPQNTFLQSGERHTGAIDVGEQHLVQFNADAGSIVFASLGEVGDQSANPRIRIVDPNGQLVAGTTVSDETGLQIGFDATITGLYTAVIADFSSNEPLSYTFSLATLPGRVDYDLPQNAFVRSGERHSGSIAVGEQHLVQFNADAGSYVLATLGEVGNQSANPRIRIVDPNGQLVAGTTVSDETGLQIGFDATITGLYTAVIADFSSNEPLSYRFRQSGFAHQPDSVELFESSLFDGVAQEGALPMGDFAVHPFYVWGGDTAEIIVSEHGSTSARVRLQVYDRSGRQVWNGSDASLEAASIFSAEPGEYFAVVMENGANANLSYSIIALGVATPFPALPGDYDGNQSVDDRDWVFWGAHYGATEGPGLYADGNGDGRVDLADYTIWRDQSGTFATPVSLDEVAEESTLTTQSDAYRQSLERPSRHRAQAAMSTPKGYAATGGMHRIYDSRMNLVRDAALLLLAESAEELVELTASSTDGFETQEAYLDEAFLQMEADFTKVPASGWSPLQED